MFLYVYTPLRHIVIDNSFFQWEQRFDLGNVFMALSESMQLCKRYYLLHNLDMNPSFRSYSTIQTHWGPSSKLMWDATWPKSKWPKWCHHY